MKRVPKCGGAVQVLAKTLFSPYQLAVDASGVYWVDPGDSGHGVMGGAMKVPLAGGTVVTLASLYDPTCIAVDAPDVFFGVPAASSIEKVPEQGGTPVTLVTEAHNPGGIATHGSRVYVAASGTALSIAKSGGVATAPGPANVIAWHIAVDAHDAYWVQGSGNGLGELRKAPLDASQPPVTLTWAAAARLAVDDSHVYWTDNGGGRAGAGTLMRAAKTGARMQPLVVGESSAIGGVALDDAFVYWLDDGSVMRRAK